jgi:hypothetical protein
MDTELIDDNRAAMMVWMQVYTPSSRLTVLAVYKTGKRMSTPYEGINEDRTLVYAQEVIEGNALQL